jgi:hypothetical protein
VPQLYYSQQQDVITLVVDTEHVASKVFVIATTIGQWGFPKIPVIVPIEYALTNLHGSTIQVAVARSTNTLSALREEFAIAPPDSAIVCRDMKAKHAKEQLAQMTALVMDSAPILRIYPSQFLTWRTRKTRVTLTMTIQSLSLTTVGMK